MQQIKRSKKKFASASLAVLLTSVATTTVATVSNVQADTDQTTQNHQLRETALKVKLLNEKSKHLVNLQKVNPELYKELTAKADAEEAKSQEAIEKQATEETVKTETQNVEQSDASAEDKNKESKQVNNITQPIGEIQFGADGLLIEQSSTLAQQAVNGLLGIPGHSNGQWVHDNGLDAIINQLSVPEAVWVIHRIEGAGFGQTGDGYAGYDTPASHRNFYQNQVVNRFGGSVHELLRHWGTYSYGGY